MSLDIDLHTHRPSYVCEHCGTRSSSTVSMRVFEANLTHNLAVMAKEAGIYQLMWRPEELGFTKACSLVAGLKQGLVQLIAEPERFKALNPPNGWGDYHGFVKVVTDYYNACVEYPDAEITVSR